MASLSVEQQVGIDAVGLRNRRHRRSWLQNELNEVLLEFPVMPAPYVRAFDHSPIHVCTFFLSYLVGGINKRRSISLAKTKPGSHAELN